MDLKKISMWLVVAGAVNIGLAAFGFDLVAMLTKATAPMVGMIVNVAIGVAGVLVGKDLMKK